MRRGSLVGSTVAACAVACLASGACALGDARRSREGHGPSAGGPVRAICDERARGGAGCAVALEELLAGGVAEEVRARIERRVLARAAAERLHAEARAAGEPSAEERARAAERAWPRHNDGPIVSVVHALFPTAPDAAQRARALADAVGARPTAEAFEAAARAAGSGIVVERIEAIGNRGRTVAGVELERAFADAAVRLTMDSPRSDVIHTSYGEHVILAIGRAEAPPVVAAAREAALAREAIAFRARDRIDTAVVAAAVRVAPDAPSALKSLGKSR